MTFRSWTSWGLDIWTWGWIAWIAFFFAWEAITMLQGQGQMLTHHLRPLFLAAPLTWFVALGLWLWIGIHFLAPPLEGWIIKAVGGY